MFADPYLLFEAQRPILTQENILPFIKSAFSEPKGPHHCWLNKEDTNTKNIARDRVSLALVCACHENSLFFDNWKHISALERVKLLQHRYPMLEVFGIQCCNQVGSLAIQTQIFLTIMENYITFPILLLDMNLPEMFKGPRLLLFEGTRDHTYTFKSDVEFETICKALEELLEKSDDAVFQKLFRNRFGQYIVREPYFGFLRNSFPFCPGSISVDEDGERLFISDGCHHRIIITDGNGKILDCIGSRPGFEDGQFEFAKLHRPAGSFYCSDQNCLYIADSENHAIRRADFERRTLETLYPVPAKKKRDFWSWLLSKIGFPTKVDEDENVVVDLDGLIFPWHLMEFKKHDFLIMNRSFETSWIISMKSGEIKSVIKGNSSNMEHFGHLIEDKVSPVKDSKMRDLPQNIVDLLIKGVSHASVMSSVASFGSHVLICDAARQKILKCHKGTGLTSLIQLSNLGILGLPYWMVSPLERNFRSGICTMNMEQVRRFKILPGRCNIRLHIDVPKGTELAVPLEETFIWRQARGSAAEVSVLDEQNTVEEMVGIAQQWFDELDNLAFSTPLEAPTNMEANNGSSNRDVGGVKFNCAVNVSPGTAELVISVVLFLKLKEGVLGDCRAKAEMILGLRDEHHRGKELVDELCVEILAKRVGSGDGDVLDMVFMRPLQLRLRLECGDHPPAPTSKEAITEETTLEVSVSLD